MDFIVFQERGNNCSGQNGVVCNWCRNVNEIVDYDYVDKPMLWCEGCGARTILEIPCNLRETDMSNLVETNKPDSKSITEFHDGCWTTKDTFDDPNTAFYLASARYILRVMDHNMVNYKCERQLNQEEIKEVIESNYAVDILAKYGVNSRLEEGETPNGDELYDKYRDTGLTAEDFWFSVVCNSYDAESPTVPYPKGVDLSHDGVHVWLELAKFPGGVEYVLYSGD